MNTILLDHAGLNKRAVNALNRAGITTLNQVKDLSENDLYKVRDLGQKSFKAVKDAIKEYLPNDNTEVILTKQDAKTIFKGITQLGTNLYYLLRMPKVDEKTEATVKEVIILISAVSAHLCQLTDKEVIEILDSVNEQFKDSCEEALV